MIKRIGLALALLAAPLPAAAQRPVEVRIEWIGNDAGGGLLVERVRSLIAGSADKREVFERRDGLAVIVQTLDPAAEWQDGVAANKRMTVYSLTINTRAATAATDGFAAAALGYCARAELGACAQEIATEIDKEIARRGLKN